MADFDPKAKERSAELREQMKQASQEIAKDPFEYWRNRPTVPKVAAVGTAIPQNDDSRDADTSSPSPQAR